jgi:hypothetical protein
VGEMPGLPSTSPIFGGKMWKAFKGMVHMELVLLQITYLKIQFVMRLSKKDLKEDIFSCMTKATDDKTKLDFVMVAGFHKS